MKRTWIALTLVLLTALPTMAQYKNQTESRTRRNPSSFYNRWTDYEREYYFGLRLGLAVAHVNSENVELDGGKGMSGLNVGIAAGIQLAESTPLFLESGLYYIEKGGKGYNLLGDKFTFDLNYLQVPIVVKYKFYMDYDLALQPFLGGFLACGVGGKMKNYGDRMAMKSFSDEWFKRFDGGIRLGCGLSYQNFYAELAYDFGLANICHDYFDSAHTGCFYATLGVDF